MEHAYKISIMIVMLTDRFGPQISWLKSGAQKNKNKLLLCFSNASFQQSLPVCEFCRELILALLVLSFTVLASGKNTNK